jgi:hypothetical protein
VWLIQYYGDEGWTDEARFESIDDATEYMDMHPIGEVRRELNVSKHRDRLIAFEEGTQSRPLFCTNEHLRWLDDLRESGRVNMFGARPLLNEEFTELTDDQAGAVLGYWMTSFGNEVR